MSRNKNSELQQLRELAWLGDAVLALYARQWILQQPDIQPGERMAVFTRMTSNHFLASFGQPTELEAGIGKVYQASGQEAAFAHIEAEIMPIFHKQRANRIKGGQG